MNEPRTSAIEWDAQRPISVFLASRRSSVSLDPRPNVANPGGLAAEHGAMIVRIAQGRDRTAFIALFQHFAPRVKSYLRRRGAPDTVAEDMAQEAMLSVWRKADRFDPTKAGAGTWIFTIARNLWIDTIRKERRPELDPSDPLLVPDGPENADSVLENEQRDDRLRTALESLPAKQAEVVRLAFFDDLTHTEVAERLGLPLGTVKSRLRLAFDRLRGTIGEDRS
jgi:RNA polymerase sigma-70 factor (ECF subfamily)